MNAEDIKSIAIIGSGTMGAGISLCFAQAGFEVNLYDVNREQLDKALMRIRSSQDALIQEQVISESDVSRTNECLHTSTNMAQALQGVQFVLEAAPEILELKQQLFREIEMLSPPDALIATNSSGLSITAISEKCRKRELTAGMHWVNPPELVPLVEVIKGQMTSESTVRTIYHIAEKAGKMPVVIRKETPGIGLNRLQFAVLREALHMMESGIVSASDIDRIMKYGLGFRHPWLGPLETADLGGLDVFHNIAGYLFKELSSEQEPPSFFNRLVEAGNYGIKTGRGFYDYTQGSSEEILRHRDLCFIRQWKLVKAMGKKVTSS